MSKLTKNIIVVAIIGAMVAVSELLHDPEVIFPEIAAIAAGAILSEKLAWHVDRKRIFITILICATLGMLIVHLPGPVYLKMTFAYLLGQLVMLGSGTSFAPMISAIVLPVMLSSKSIHYLMSAAFFTAIILIAHAVKEKSEPKVDQFFKPQFTPGNLMHVGMRTVLMLLMIYGSFKVNMRFMVAPPLLVAFTEFTNPHAKARQRPIVTILLMGFCATAGALSRLIFTMQLGLPLTFAAVVASIFFVLMMDFVNLYIPPVGACTILAMLIPAKYVAGFPMQALFGVLILMALSILVFKEHDV